MVLIILMAGAALMVSGDLLAKQQVTLYGKAISHGVFKSNDGRLYHFSDREAGKQVMMLSDIWASRIALKGAVHHANGKWMLDVEDFEKYSCGYGTTNYCKRYRSNIPEVRLN